MCMIDDCEPCVVSRSTERTAVWDHRCDECRRTITAGERYEVHAGLYDGHWTTNKTCAHCLAARRWLKEVCGGWLFEFVWDEIEEHWREEWMMHSLPFGRLILTHRKDPHFERTSVVQITEMVTASVTDVRSKLYEAARATCERRGWTLELVPDSKPRRYTITHETYGSHELHRLPSGESIYSLEQREKNLWREQHV